jgi:spermidine synthase
MTLPLFFSIFVIATCGLIYELIAGTLATYLLGDSVTQFSTVIGVYLFAMGIGSFLSKYIERHLVSFFVQIEVLIGLIGGCSAAVLFILFHHLSSFRIFLYLLVLLIGILIGLEIPLLIRILKDELDLKEVVAKVMTFDYIGALVASILFPLLLAPRLGLIRTCFLFGIFNILVALWTLSLFRNRTPWATYLRTKAMVILIGLVFGFIYSDRLTRLSEEALYTDRILYARSSPYQRIVLARWGQDLRLYLNGHLQFSSGDEYRYHEALIHPALQALDQPRKALVLGGGDGLAVREILKYPTVESITLVDLDPEMTALFSRNELLRRLNQNAFASAKVKIINADAFIWLKESREQFDFIAVDFPDPTNYSLGKLYTTAFYRQIKRALTLNGAAVIQSTSPLFARKSFWCIDQTLREVGFRTSPYHAYVPSFGEWGFIIATHGTYSVPTRFLPSLQFLTSETAESLFRFPPDMAPVPTEVNRLENQILVRYYDEEWSRYELHE